MEKVVGVFFDSHCILFYLTGKSSDMSYRHKFIVSLIDWLVLKVTRH